MQDIAIIRKNIINSMNSIFAFSLSRTNNSAEAEDLSQQIITELLSSANSLKNINAFYGWMWSVAKNTYGKYSRKRAKERSIQSGYDIDFIDSDDFYGSYGGMNTFIFDKSSVEDEIILKEDTNLLKRELSLLAYKYREAVVKYYLEDKSCAQISEELSVTVETVKHLLFKARKILKEGINMNREFGEKSYKPGIFRINKWVQKYSHNIHEIDQLFNTRKMPGNIMLSAYYTPLTTEEISMELGVAAPYLEDEIKILLKHGLLKQLQNGRYQTNLFIYTTACNEDIMLKTKDLFKKYAQKLTSFVDGKLSEVKDLIFKNDDVSQNKLRWFITHFVLWHGSCKSQEDVEMPPLETGGTGYLWGHNHEREDGHGFKGIYGKMGSERYSGWVHASNYMLLEKCQSNIGHNPKVNDFLLAAAHKKFDDFTPDEIAQYLQWDFIEKDGDSYKSLCNVMTQAQYDKLCEMCSDAVNEMRALLSETISVITKVMENHAPAAIKEHCRPLAVVNTDGMADIIEDLVEDGYLIIPKQHEFLTIYTVI